MADDGSAQSQTVWPLPMLYFQVRAGKRKMDHKAFMIENG